RSFMHQSLPRAISKGNFRSNNFACWESLRGFNESRSIRLLFLHRAYRTEGVTIMGPSVTLPRQLPVMPLPAAVLFPHALLPLYIFESRYRQMLQHTLQHHRMFCVTLIKPSCPEWHAPEDFFHFATVGLIRACVGRGDGTSNLVLQGLHRVRFKSFEQETPFPVAKIDIVESTDNAATAETEAIGEHVLEP